MPVRIWRQEYTEDEIWKQNSGREARILISNLRPHIGRPPHI